VAVTGVVYDGRWTGQHGIGRFSDEVLSRLPWPVEALSGHHPVSPLGILELDLLARRAARRTGADWFVSPGYGVPATWRSRAALTVHDLIHLDVAGEGHWMKDLYYQRVVRRFVRRADVVLTVSEFSRGRIVDWSGADPDSVVVVGNGVSEDYFVGAAERVSRDYILFVGNHKPHKNVSRLVEAVSRLSVGDVRLAFTGPPDAEVVEVARMHGLADRLDFLGPVPEADLPLVYARAAAVAIPSLYEGFGLPALEGMAAGVPVVASTVTALPEVVGDVGIGVDPLDVASIGAGLDRALGDTEVRTRAATLGPVRAREFTWDRVAARLVAAIESRC
jgi:glycosyltransferase involved in cell wall biosynthesis